MVAFDPSTGDLFYDKFTDSNLRSELDSRLNVLLPIEILLFDVSTIFESWVQKYRQTQKAPIRVEKTTEAVDISNVQSLLFQYFSSQHDTLELLVKLDRKLQACIWVLISYLKQFGLDMVFELPIHLQPFSLHHTFHLSPSALQHLDIFNHSNEPSLYSLLNHSHFPVSSRLLKTWLLRPLMDEAPITARQAAVQELLDQWEYLTSFMHELRTLGDAEKLFMKIHYRRISPFSLYTFLSQWITVVRAISAHEFTCPLLQQILRDILASQTEVSPFFQAMNKEAALNNDKVYLWEHPSIKDLHDQLSEVRDILNLESRNAAKAVHGTVVSNSGAEFLIEVPRSRKVDSAWLRVSATTHVLRFYTPKISELLKQRDVILEKLKHHGTSIFSERLRSFSRSSFLTFSLAIKKLAELDCLMSLAKVAQIPGYTVPKLSNEHVLKIEEGRHPVLETLVDCVPNSVELSHNAHRSLIVSGLNMGGKSSFVRMIALNVLLAHIGSHVPAKSAEFGIFDGIFTRMGASDDMVKGLSTFLVEMSETADILKRITPRSLVILDELGRGTSTNDGMAIAYAVLKHIIETKQCFLLFITHYLQLSSLVEQFPEHVQCGHMGFLKSGDRCTFLYKFVAGMAESSHGLNVARLAHLPESILSLAAQKSRESELKDRLPKAYSQLVCQFKEMVKLARN